MDALNANQLFSLTSRKEMIGILKKKYLLCLAVCQISSVLVFSQQTEISSDQYGVKAGINFAELFGEDAIPGSDRKVGYSFGIYGAFKISKTLKIQPEVIWSLQGEKSESKGRYDISYINFPVMLKWTEGRFYSELGPQLGILTINTSKSVPDSIRLENFETFDLSINIGAGYEVFEDWIIGLRYIQGITDIVADKDLKNSVIYLGVSYRIF
jgi:hypothetical protein